MKRAIYLLVLILVAGGLACDGEGIGEYPINRVDDTVFIMVEPDDYFVVRVSRDSWSADVERPYGDGTSIVFHVWEPEEINHVHIMR